MYPLCLNAKYHEWSDSTDLPYPYSLLGNTYHIIFWTDSRKYKYFSMQQNGTSIIATADIIGTLVNVFGNI